MKPAGSTGNAINNRVQQPATETDFYRELAGMYFDLGTVLVAQRQPQEALPTLRRSLSYLDSWSPKNRRTIDYPEKLAATQLQLGMALEATGHPDEALRAYLQASQLWESLLKKFPKATNFRTNLDDAKHRLNHLLASWPAIG
jgi:tetratricopeptide (TPR) repeat protein